MSLKSERRVTKESGVPFNIRASGDLAWLQASPDSPLRCDACGASLGVLHTLRQALFRRKGQIYFVCCRGCGTMNKRIKGALAEEMDRRWEQPHDVSAGSHEDKNQDLNDHAGQG